MYSDSNQNYYDEMCKITICLCEVAQLCSDSPYASPSVALWFQSFKFPSLQLYCFGSLTLKVGCVVTKIKRSLDFRMICWMQRSFILLIL